MKNYLTTLREIAPGIARVRSLQLAVAVAAVGILIAQSNGISTASASTPAQANQLPVAVDDNYSTAAGTPLLVPAPGFLGNDYDPDGDPLTMFSYSALQPSSPQPGDIIVNVDGSFAFDPAQGFTGTVSFVYFVSDGPGSFSPVSGRVYITVRAPNRPPAADAGGPYLVAAGDSVTLDASASSDPDGDPLTYTWDLNGDGVFGGPGDVSGATAVFDSASLPAPSTRDITLLVDDGMGGNDVDTATVSILSNAPSVAVTGDAIDEGGTATVQFSITDSTLNDSHMATIDWGDGSAVVDLGEVTSPASTSHRYAEDGAYTVLVSVVDGEGNSANGTTTVTVSNVAPVVDAGPDAAIAEGDSFSLAPSTFSDEGALDTHSANISWGDGSISAGTVTESAGSGTVAGTHRYTAAGIYRVTVTVTDDEGDSGSSSFVVDVATVEPGPAPTPVPVPTATSTPKPEPTATPANGSTPGVWIQSPSEPPEEPKKPARWNQFKNRWGMFGSTPNAPEEVVHRVRNSFENFFQELIRFLQRVLGGG